MKNPEVKDIKAHRAGKVLYGPVSLRWLKVGVWTIVLLQIAEFAYEHQQELMKLGGL